MENEVKKSNILKIIGNVLFYGVILLLLIFSIITINTKEVEDIPNLFGNGFIAVKSDSMEGTFSKDSVIFVKVLKHSQKESIDVNDVITFYDQSINALNTHRVINKITQGSEVFYQTQGDNTPYPDEQLIHQSNVLAVYKRNIPKLGALLGFMQTQLGFGLLVILPMFLLLAYQAYVLFKDIYQIKKEKLLAQYELDKEAEKARMREELLKELNKEERK